MKIKNIINGWANVVKDKLDSLEPELKEMSEKRLAHCHSCNLRLENTCSRKAEGYHVETLELKSGCGCNLSAKTLDPGSECPLGKWKKEK